MNALTSPLLSPSCFLNASISAWRPGSLTVTYAKPDTRPSMVCWMIGSIYVLPVRPGRFRKIVRVGRICLSLSCSGWIVARVACVRRASSSIAPGSAFVCPERIARRPSRIRAYSSSLNGKCLRKYGRSTTSGGEQRGVCKPGPIVLSLKISRVRCLSGVVIETLSHRFTHSSPEDWDSPKAGEQRFASIA